MKKITLLLVLGLFVFSCTKEDPNEIITTDQVVKPSQKLLSIEEVNKYIAGELKKNGDVVWKDAPANVLWSAVVHGGEILSVGYGQKGESFSTSQRSPRLVEARKRIVDVVLKREQVNKSSTLVSDDDTFNVVDLKVSKLETIVELQNQDQIRYMDPAYGHYLEKDEAQQKSSKGCSQQGESINGGDFRMISPNARLPWNFDRHNIAQAWGLSTGAGITVGVVDTGLSANQHLLLGGINDGYSSGRYVQRYGTYIESSWWWSNNVDGPNDRCGHGTQMAAAIASPRNDDNMPVGVAYNCNLVVYRGTSDVVLNDYHERKGVSNALKQLGNRGDVKIISMSVGYPWTIGNVKDAVKYAHARGKLIFAAGGTSTTFTNWYGVIFPADMFETVAVTGIKDNGYNLCDNCHDGNRIDFTTVMQRSWDSNRTTPVLGFYTGNQSYVGGSSVATAMVAGIAALVWARNPNMNRDQVYDKMKRAAEFYPNRSGNLGYGNIDAWKAVQ